MRAAFAILGALLPALQEKPAPGLLVDQFVLLDVVHTHGVSSKGFSFFPLPADVPDDWTKPVDFFTGTIHFRLEVISKPTDRPVNYQMCIFQDQHSAAKHACDSTRTFTEPGVLEWESSLSSFFQAKVIDYKRRILDTMLVVKDKNGDPVDALPQFMGKWDGSPDWSLFYPMTVRFTAVALARGARHNPAVTLWRVGDLHWKDLRALRSLAAPWQRGQLGSVLQGALKEVESPEADRGAEAKRIVAAFAAWTASRKKELDALRLDQPDWAVRSLLQLGQALSPAPAGRELVAEAKAWEKDPAVAAARKARSIWESLQPAARRVRGKGKASDPAFARQFAGELKALAVGAARLRKDFPDAPSTREAVALTDALALSLPDP